MNSSFLKPMSPIDISQITISIPSSPASFNMVSSDMTFCFFIRYEIILGPIPAIFMLDSLSCLVPLGSIAPNIFEMKSLPGAVFLGSRSAESDQNEKNSLTCVSIAAAAIDMTNAASTLSKSPDTTAIDN